GRARLLRGAGLMRSSINPPPVRIAEDDGRPTVEFYRWLVHVDKALNGGLFDDAALAVPLLQGLISQMVADAVAEALLGQSPDLRGLIGSMVQNALGEAVLAIPPHVSPQPFDESVFL